MSSLQTSTSSEISPAQIPAGREEPTASSIHRFLSETQLHESTVMPKVPWTTTPGYYTRPDGAVVYVAAGDLRPAAGRHRSWSVEAMTGERGA
ncbi:hypothetical protein SVAN01_05402 [Stagonosporopsis vannaccii]|nr:hypothetical protein SVAN01_05402 [Stagonosporopsis vannaccii]